MPETSHNCQQPILGPALTPDLPPLPHGFTTGQGIPIAVIDTGAANPGTTGDRDHCLLHGTAVASVVKFVAPGAQLHSIRHSPHPDRAEGTVADLIGAIDKAREHKSKIINISMVACEDLPQLREAITRAQNSGALVVASIGNRGQCEEGTAPFPATIEGVIGVGAVEPRADNPQDGAWNAGRVAAEYSAPGPWADLYAPGGPISAALHVDGTVHTVVGDPHPFFGTSFAAPVVSGTAALVWRILPSYDAADIRSLILDTATPGGNAPGSTQPIQVVDPQAAVERALEIKQEQSSSENGETAPHGTTVGAGLSTTVQANPVTPETVDYVVPGAVALLVFIVAIAALVARAFSSDRNPPSGSVASTRHGA